MAPGRAAGVKGLAVLAAVACLLAVPVAAPGLPGAATRLHLGVLGNPARFASQTAQRSSTRLIFVGWNQGSTPAYFTKLLATMLDEPMLGLTTGSAGGPRSPSPAEIARGRGDAFLLALNGALARWGKPVFVRPLAEMNGHWNAYSAYNANGSSRGPDHSTAIFKKAFARIYLIVHGGPAVNERAQVARPSAGFGAAAACAERQRDLESPGVRLSRSARQLRRGVLPGRRLRRRRRRRSLRHRRQGGVGSRRRALRARTRASRSRSGSGGSGASTTRSSCAGWRRSCGVIRAWWSRTTTPAGRDRCSTSGRSRDRSPRTGR